MGPCLWTPSLYPSQPLNAQEQASHSHKDKPWFSDQRDPVSQVWEGYAGAKCVKRLENAAFGWANGCTAVIVDRIHSIEHRTFQRNLPEKGRQAGICVWLNEWTCVCGAPKLSLRLGYLATIDLVLLFTPSLVLTSKVAAAIYVEDPATAVKDWGFKQCRWATVLPAKTGIVLIPHRCRQR